MATLIALVDLALTAPVTTSDAASAVPTATQSEPPVQLPLPGCRTPHRPRATPGRASPPRSPVPRPTSSRARARSPSSTASPPVYGSGPLQRFVVEVEDGIGVDGAAFATAVEATLGDPRSWGSGGRMSFQRVGAAEAAAGQYDFKVSLISPGSMETYCPGVGTGGYTSCRYGERAVINLARWATAVPHYDGDIETYRHYVVNHEVGHVLGKGHVDCPGPGQVAPVMLQQTLGLEGCVKNAWPYP